MSETGSGARKRRLSRRALWRILVFQLPLLLVLLGVAIYWLEGHLESALRATSLRLGRHTAELAASAASGSGTEFPILSTHTVKGEQ